MDSGSGGTRQYLRLGIPPLVEDFIVWSRDRGAARLHVSAYAANSAAIHFYQGHGFVPLSIELTVDLLANDRQVSPLT